ncbi:unnamed protein product [Prorocentrum cordatum]|uniref:Uncharacterized protein n=1 Tax=Prorocentrum cordatum TaxID=2364126 RepID=A0ABN9XX69_9DINO|nr:unnamed protein product [Polarella glacialis]
MSCRLRTQFEPHLLSRDISSDVLVGRFSSFVNLFARYHESNPIALAKYSASSHERQIVCDVLVRTVFVFCALVAISSLCLIFLQDGSLFPLLRYVCSGGASVDPDKWVCECGFANRLINTVCGGGGPLGCKQQRPGCVGAARTPADDGDSWTCSCGFVNSAKNVQCGGKGVLGCKKARAEQDRVLCLNMLLLSWRSIVQSYKLAGGLIWGAAG